MADDPTSPDADGERPPDDEPDEDGPGGGSSSGPGAEDPDEAPAEGPSDAPSPVGGEGPDGRDEGGTGAGADEREGEADDGGADVDVGADEAEADVDAGVEGADATGDAEASEAVAEADAGTDAGDAAEDAGTEEGDDAPDGEPAHEDVPADVRKYERFTKVDGAQYDRVNDFLRERTYITAREWAIARLCADFRTETGVEMTKIGENLDVLVPFMEDTYSPQAVNQARSSFEEKVTKAGATFLYGAMCDFFTAEELDELMYEVTEVAKFLLEVEGVDLSVEDELAAEDRISGVMREVREASEALRYEECPHCGEQLHD